MTVVLSKKLEHLRDDHILTIQRNWFEQPHAFVEGHEYMPIADEWFRSTHRNDLIGWNQFPCVDVILGCTHFIESLLIKSHGCVQVLSEEYAYYGLIGLHGTPVGQLKPGVPLLISLPNWKYADLRPEWEAVLRECEQKKIDIHIDMAWLVVSRDISIDLTHPCIKSFAMSLSKYGMEWNRIGLRWSRQRTMDPITMFNRYQGIPNSALTSCGAYIMQNLPREYAWDTYGERHQMVCQEYNLLPTKAIHVAHSLDRTQVWGIADLLLGGPTPNSI